MDYLAQCHYKNPYKREAGGSNSAVSDVKTVAKGWRDAKMGPPAKECRSSGRWKPKETDLP